MDGELVCFSEGAINIVVRHRGKIFVKDYICPSSALKCEVFVGLATGVNDCEGESGNICWVVRSQAAFDRDCISPVVEQLTC